MLTAECKDLCFRQLLASLAFHGKTLYARLIQPLLENWRHENGRFGPRIDKTRLD